MHARRLCALVVGGLLCLTVLLSACTSNPLQTTHQSLSTATPQHAQTSVSTGTNNGNPVRLLIPAINVNAPIETVGLDGGNLATPTQTPWDGTGWYNLGPRPGEMGSAVIDGHLDRPGGAPAVFWNLRELHIGDQITVVDSQGQQMHFHVTRVEAYSPDAAPTQAIFGDTSGRYLNLITCAGLWIPSQHQTTLREVVYSALDV